MSDSSENSCVEGVAIIGMAGRFPGAKNTSEFWRIVSHGIETISHFSVEELEVAGAAERAKQPNYVRARAVLENTDEFDAAFFNILPREAERIDPQHRVFLECCWEALEDAGYDPQTYRGAIGVFAGCSANSYFLRNLCTNREFIEEYTAAYQVGQYQTLLGTNHDFLATRVSYKLDLKGPSFTMQAGCSTSLLAVCQACQSLLSYQSDMALAGGVSITFPQKRGYTYQEGGMGSADGHCRPFDANANGTVFGGASAVVLLKRLEDAVADGDHVYAVIRGFAVNNDGSAKVGYTAPSVEGQAEVIAMAQAMAGVNPESIGYIEAHGTATPLGDPIEFAALMRAFRSQTNAKNYCALGAAKANVGHLDVAAGVTGLINAVHALRHQQIPPLLHFRAPNPRIDMTNSPFYANTTLTEWKRGTTPRRAGVSAFGVGGTNAHVILEEAPESQRPRVQRPGCLFTLSARTATALDAATKNLADHLRSHPELDLDDVSYTLQIGRRAFDHRRTVVCANIDDAIRNLEGRSEQKPPTGVFDGRERSLVFMFPGQGAQYVGMGAGLYQNEESFRKDIDDCSQILSDHLGLDLRAVLYPNDDSAEAPELRDTRIAQPAIFAIEYGLARLWMRWGLVPQAMIGHSIGEFVAACLANVFSLEDALAMVATRGRLMQDLPSGAMLSVRLPAADVTPLLNDELSIAAVNSPALCVVSGPETAIGALQQHFDGRGIQSRRLVTSHAFHSRMMDPMIEPFTEYLHGFRYRAPTIPYVSGVTGKWITFEQATDPAYWARHVRESVQFSAGVRCLAAEAERVFLEVGPGRALTTLAKQHQGQGKPIVTVTSLPDATTEANDALIVLAAVGQLWLHGIRPNWEAMHGPERRRCSLPTYPFERQRFWIETPRLIASPNVAATDALTTSSASETLMPLITETLMTETTAKTPSATSRRERVRARLTVLVEELSGLHLSESDVSTSFLELGFDSLFLTMVTLELQSCFGVKITFRQLLDQESTLDALADFIDREMPADAAAWETSSETETIEATAVVPAVEQVSPRPDFTPALTHLPAMPSINGDSPLEIIIHEQLQAMSELMSKQLQMFRSGTVAASSPAVNGIAKDVTPPTKSAEASPSTTGQDFRTFGPYKPPRTSADSALTERQREYVSKFIKRYSAHTAKSKEFTQKHRRRLADPRVVSGFHASWKEIVYPIVTVKSKGCRLWDLDGNEYVDILNGFGPIMLGHAPSFVTEAVAKQLALGFEIGPQTPLAGEVAELICDMTGNERVTFCNTGSEAVMAALRVARTVTGRKKFVLFAGAYHGMFDEVLVKGVARNGQPHAVPIAPGIPPEAVSNTIVLEFGTEKSLAYIRAHAKELAAVLVEPVQSRHPDLQPVEFLRELRKITEESDTALIFDEVVTGFRVHPGGAQALFDIRADLVTYGKVVGGGLPIGILAGKAKFMDALDGGMWQYGDDSYPERGVTFFAGTFVRHPLALAAVKAVLQHLIEQGPRLQEELGRKTAGLATNLNAYFEERNVPTQIQRFGSIFYFSFPPDQRLGSLLYYHLRENGVHIQEGFPCFLTTAHSDVDIEHVIQAFKQSIAEMQEGSLLPAPPKPVSDVSLLPSAVIADRTPEETPLTEAQLEILLSAMISDEASCAFNESFTLRLQGPLDTGALCDSIQEMIVRHDSFFSTFDGQNLVQRFQPPSPIEIPIIDLAPQASPKVESQLAELVRRDSAKPFDLVRGPLARVALVRLTAEDHAMIFTAHHIICDGWSTNVLLNELSQLYGARSKGTKDALPVASKFQDYVLSEAECRTNAAHAAVEKWWVEKYAVPVSPLELPTDRPRASVKTYAGNTARARVDAATMQKIRRFGARHGCTLFATLLAGFEALLHRLTNQEDIAVGIPAAGQSALDDTSLIGHCVHFLPLRSMIGDDTTVAALLSQAKHTLLDAYEHQNYTYGSLVRALGSRRDPSRLPLVEVQFNLDRVGPGLAFPGLRCEVDPNPKSFANFDLFLNIGESERGLLLDCDYNTDLFDEATIQRWLGHYQTVLEAMVAEPSTPVCRLPLLSDDERQRLVVEKNSTSQDYPKDKCIHHLIGEQAEKTPDAVALVFGDEELTYAELNTRTNQLARFLQRHGIGPETRVGICFERSADMLLSVIAVLKAGGAYVPLDPGYPHQRIMMVLEDAKPALLLTHEATAGRLGNVPIDILCLDAAWPTIKQECTGQPENSASPDSMAYLIFTSGSTGRPKGVQVTHRNVVNLLTSMAREPGLTAEDRLFAVTTLSFDISVLELFLPLTVGARVIIAAPGVLGDGFKLKAQLQATGATVMQTTPAAWRLLLAAAWNDGHNLKILCGGEALPRDLANELLVRSPDVWNMYGPTETTVWSAASRVECGDGPVTIGPPIANTQFYVVDRAGQLAPIGVPGELWIGGDGVALGYWNDPKQTAEKFLRDPFRNDPAARIYRTGDLVRALPNGRFEFLGRLDNQVKVRGFRIETAEIELALAQHDGIHECVVVVREDLPGDRRLVAYFVPSGETPANHDLREFLSSRLPEYMIPSAFVALNALPKTSNGKIDRKALPAVDVDAYQSQRPYVEPRNAREETMARIAAEVLGLPRVSVEASLFDLGADSLHIFRMVARATDHGMHLTLKQILEHRTVAAICADVERRGPMVQKDSGPQLVAASRDRYRVRRSELAQPEAAVARGTE